MSARIEQRACATASVGPKNLHNAVEVWLGDRKEICSHHEQLALFESFELRTSLQPRSLLLAGRVVMTRFRRT
jgi:hypothetical protein